MNQPPRPSSVDHALASSAAHPRRKARARTALAERRAKPWRREHAGRNTR